jgi:hypothetical protein
MKKKLLIAGSTVLLLIVVPVAALNLFRSSEEEPGNEGQGRNITREDDREITRGDGKDLENDGEENDGEENDGKNREDEESSGNGDDEGSDGAEKGREEPSKQDSAGNSGDSKGTDGDSDNSEEDREQAGKDSQGGKENPGESKDSANSDQGIVWGELGFSDTIDAFLAENDGDLTRRNLAKLSVLFYEQLSGNEAVAAWDETFNDTKNPWVLKAYNLEIVPRTDSGNFDPDRRISRQEGAYTFYRTLRALNRSHPDGDFTLEAGDIDRVETWAFEAMEFMDHYKILPRRESNRLHPDSEITSREIRALWSNTRQWMESYQRSEEKLKPPTGIFAYEDQGAAKIGWTPVKNADYYYVYESATKDGPFHAFNNRDGKPMKVYWDEEYSLKVTGLTEGKTYYYRVRAVVDGIQSSESEIVKVSITAPQARDFEDYEDYLMSDHRSFIIAETVVNINWIEVSRGAEEDSLNLRYYLDQENSQKVRRLIRDGYHEDLRTLYGYIIREMSEFYGKDIEAYLIYEDFGLETYPNQYQDNRIEPNPIGKDEDGTYFVWFPYLEMHWDAGAGAFSHRWFYRNSGV